MFEGMPDTQGSKIVVPITLALAAGWAVASIVYGAGTKVGSSEKDIAYLAAKCDTLAATIEAGNKEQKAAIRDDHEALIELRVKFSTLKEYVDTVEASIKLDEKKR